MPARRSKGFAAGARERPRRVTSYDVGRRVGVSQATVSRCFMPGSRVSTVLRERIIEVANELGYRPNAIARSLITRRSNLVAIVISNLTNLFYPEVLSELSKNLSQRGIRVLLFTLPREGDIDLVLDQIWQYQVDGVVLAARLSAAQVAEFDQHRVPLVFFNRYLRNRAVNSVWCDQLQGARELVTRLHAAGHRRFAVVSGPAGSIVGQERVRGVAACIKDLGAAEPLVIDGDYGYDGGVRAMHEIASAADGTPDAIICTNDVAAIGCIDAARLDFGIKIPDRLSIVGFDGVDPARWKSYRLTTLRQPVQQMAEAAVGILMSHIEDASLAPEKRVFSGEVLEGGSARLG